MGKLKHQSVKLFIIIKVTARLNTKKKKKGGGEKKKKTWRKRKKP